MSFFGKLGRNSDTQLAKKLIGNNLLVGSKIIHDTIEKIMQIREQPRTTHNLQKKYVDFR